MLSEATMSKNSLVPFLPPAGLSTSWLGSGALLTEVLGFLYDKHWELVYILRVHAHANGKNRQNTWAVGMYPE